MVDDTKIDNKIEAIPVTAKERHETRVEVGYPEKEKEEVGVQRKQK